MEEENGYAVAVPHISTLFGSFEMPKKQKTLHEFQVVGQEIADWCGVPFKKVLPLFTNPKWQHNKVKDAYAIAKKRGINKVGYIIGIMNNL